MQIPDNEEECNLFVHDAVQAGSWLNPGWLTSELPGSWLNPGSLTSELPGSWLNPGWWTSELPGSWLNPGWSTSELPGSWLNPGWWTSELPGSWLNPGWWTSELPVVVQRFPGFPWSVWINPQGSGCKWSADRLIKKLFLNRKPEPEAGIFMFGCSLFVLISVSTVGLEPSEMTLAMSNESCNRNQWIYKMPNKSRQKLYFATLLDEKKKRWECMHCLGRV